MMITFRSVMSHYRNATFICGGEEGKLIEWQEGARATYISRKTLKIGTADLARVKLRKLDDISDSEKRDILHICGLSDSGAEVIRREQSIVEIRSEGGILSLSTRGGLSVTVGGMEVRSFATVVLYLMDKNFDIFQLAENGLAIIYQA